MIRLGQVDARLAQSGYNCSLLKFWLAMTNYLLHIAMGIHQGLHRKTNEDAIAYEYPTHFDVLRQRGVLLAVADGVATISGGGVASETALKRLIALYYEQPDYMNCRNALLDAIKKVNAELHQMYAGSSTTLVAAVIHENRLIVAHAGDSRAYWLHGNVLKQITNDHTVNALQPNGKVKAKLKRAIGHQAIVDVDMNEMLLEEGDTILLVSDGITRYLGNEELRNWLQAAPIEAVRGIIQAANQAGGHDNSSVVIARVGAKLEVPYKLAMHLAEMQPQVLVEIPDVELPAKQITQEIAIPHDALGQGGGGEVKPASNWYGVRLIVSLLILGTIIMYFVASNQQPTNPTPVLTVTVIPTTPALTATHTVTATVATATATLTPTVTPTLTVTATASAVPQTGELIIGMHVQFAAQEVTYARIGQQTTALVLSPQRIYRVADIVIDVNNQKWYRLYDALNELSGWIQHEHLPAYQIMD
jgi:serine/threonine protein phosphatase PrpC